MEQEIIDKMKPGCQLGSSTRLYPKNSNANQILALANAVIAAAAGNSVDSNSVLLTRPGPERLTRLKTLMQILDPVKNNFVFSEEAFKVVCDAWCLLSDLQKKTHDDKDTSFVDNEQHNKEKEEPVSGCTKKEQKRTLFKEKDNALENNEKESEEGGENTKNDEKQTFWAVCPYCYILYEYEKVYEECCLRCQNCRRGFQAVAVPEPKSDMLVEGQDAYYSKLGVFALKYHVDASTNTHVGGGGMCNSHSGDDVIEISDSADDDNGGDKSMSVNNSARKHDKAKEDIVKGNAKSGEEGSSNVMQGSGKAEKGNGGKRRMHVKSVGRKSKLKRRPVKSRRIEGLDQNVKSGEGFKGDGHEVEIGSGSGTADVDR